MPGDLPTQNLREFIAATFDDAVMLVDREGTVLEASPSVASLYGREVVGQPITTFIPERFHPQALQRARDLCDGAAAHSFQATHLKGAGTPMAVSVEVTGITVGARRLAAMRVKSLGESRLIEADASARLTRALANAGTFERRRGGDQEVLSASAEVYEIFGVPPGTPLDNAWFASLVHPDDRARLTEVRDAGFGPNGFRQVEVRILRRGEVRWLQVFSQVTAGSPEAPEVITGVIRDVTERHQSLLALTASERRLRLILNSTAEGVLMRSLEGVITFANRRLEELFGYGPGEMIGLSAVDLVVPEETEWVRSRIADFRAGRSMSREAQVRRKDGTTFWARARAEPLRDETGQVIAGLGTFTDITIERRAHQAEQLLARLVESSNDAIYSHSPDGGVLSFNRAAEKLTGRTREQMLGQKAGTMLRPRAPAEPNVEPADAELYELTRPDGTVREVRLTTFPIDGDGGGATATGVILRDVTDERAHERDLASMQKQLFAAQKLEAIGSLAGGIAHDFNNILTVIVGSGSLAANELAEGTPARRNLDEVLAASERATTLVRQLLAFGRRQVLKPGPVDLSRLVHQVKPMLSRLIGEQIDFQVSAAASPPPVLADPAQLEQVVLNLCVNARDAMPKGGRLELSVRPVDLDAAFCARQLDAKPGAYVKLSVRDHGVGMTPDTQARLFEPFFSTKGDKGTGLGLSTVFGVVKQSGGFIRVESEPGHGSTFDVYLPCAAGVAPHAEAPVAQARGGTETVLLAEDEEQVRTLLAAVLTRAGYKVLLAQTPGDALLQSEQFKGHIHLLLTDVVMPRLSGPELAGRLAKLRPTMKTLYMSGYTNDAALAHGIRTGAVEFIEKPLTPTALLRKVRDVLDS